VIHRIRFRLPLLAALCLALAACASAPKTVPYSNLASASSLAPNRNGNARRVPYRYSANADWHTYHKLIIDPVEIYQGPDQQFGTLSDEDKSALADYMSSRFSQVLQQRFTLVATPGPQTLRLKLTLLGAMRTKPVVGTFTRLDIAGNIYNSVQSAVGGRGSFTGEAIYAIEIYDAVSNRLLEAYVTQRYPRPYNVKATFGALTAAKVGIQKGADDLLARLSETE
jgi:hypothetical protein